MPTRTDRPLELDEFEDWRDNYVTQQFFQFLRDFRQQVIDEFSQAIQAGETVTPEKQQFIHGSFAVIEDILSIEFGDLTEEETQEEGEESVTT